MRKFTSILCTLASAALAAGCPSSQPGRTDGGTSGTDGGAQANALIGHWYGQTGPNSDPDWIAGSDLVLRADGTFQFWSGFILEATTFSTAKFYTYTGQFSISGDRIAFKSMTAHTLTKNGVRVADYGVQELWKETTTNGTPYTPPDSEYTVAIQIRNGERTAVFRPTGGATEPSGLAAASDKTDDQLDFYSYDVLKKLDDTMDNAVIVNEDILADQTWTADKIYKLCPSARAASGDGFRLHIKAALTIQPGTIVRAVNGVELAVYQNGKIAANGTSDNPVTFSLSNDPSDNPTSSDKHWNGIWMDGSPIRLKNLDGGVWNGTQKLTCSYCNVSGAMVGIYADGGDTHLDHCTFSGNDIGLTLKYEPGNATIPASTANAQSCAFQNNRVPVEIDTNVSFDGTNHIDGATNYYGGIYVLAQNPVHTAVTWSNTDVPYVISYWDAFPRDGVPDPADALAMVDPTHDYGPDLSISNSPAGSLTLADGVALKFRSSQQACDNECDDSFSMNQGANLAILGTSAAALKSWQGATFTIYYDDGVKGDTDRFTPAALGSRAYWAGIYHRSPDGFSRVYLTETDLPGSHIAYAEHH